MRQWAKSQWDQVRGNFKYDVIKYLAFGGGVALLGLIAGYWQKLAHHPASSLELVLIPLVGFLVMGAFALFLNKTNPVRVQLEATSGPNHILLLTVTNKGKEMPLAAYGEIIGHPNGVNPYKTGKFRLKWREGHDAYVSAYPNSPESVVIATFEHTIISNMKSAHLWEVAGENHMKYCSFQWYTSDKDSLPSFTLQVTIVDKGATGPPHVENFTLRPETSYGPLEMISLGVPA